MTVAGLPDGVEAAVAQATRRLAKQVRETPLIRSRSLERLLGVEVHLKLECLQETGSFKYRPALNSVLAAIEAGPIRGFVTSSSGNFGIAAAAAARVVGARLELVMMPSASGHKAEVARGLGAHIVTCRDDYAAREELVRALVTEQGLHALHPHDSLATLGGDATVGVEIAAQLATAGSVVVPTSGGGLLGGIAAAYALAGLEAEIHGAQPAGNASMTRSLAAGGRRKTDRVVTIADGLTAAIPGELGFALARSQVRSVGLAEEDQIVAALRLLAREERLMVEPAAAVPLAAMLAGTIQPKPPVVLVLSGANIAPRAWADLIGA